LTGITVSRGFEEAERIDFRLRPGGRKLESGAMKTKTQ
jgi:hypothetical protein